MTTFSANLGFLWADLSLPNAIHAAANAGFHAVECHWPYATPSSDARTALNETKLSMLSINTIRGDSFEFGLNALPNREVDARRAIDQAIVYAVETNTRSIHAMAGIVTGEDAHKTFVNNLKYACKRAQPYGITILIEPLNYFDAPDYFLQTTVQALKIIEEVGSDTLKLMFDCYHVQIMEGDLLPRLEACLPNIGHIQFASVPDRTSPTTGEIDYKRVFAQIDRLGYTAPLGAEYKPQAKTELTLDWMKWT